MFTETTLKKALSRLLFEYSGATQSRSTAPGRDVPQGAPTYDKLAGKLGDNKETTISSELPLEPSDMMAAQLANDRPPVEDDTFIPTNSNELSRAASILAGLVPADNIDKFYNDLKGLVDSEVDDETDAMPIGASEKMPTDFDEGVPRPGTGPQLEAILREVYGDPASLDDLASIMGKSGPSGARQEIERIMTRARYWAENATMQDLETLKTVAVGTFVDGLFSNGFIDEDEVVELQQSPVAVKELPSFQFFFVNSMILPAYKKIRKMASDSAYNVIDSLGLPSRSKQSYINMIMGDVPFSSRKLRIKIIKDAMAGGSDSISASRLALHAVNQYPDVKRAAKLGTDFVGAAVDKFHSMNPRKTSLLIKTALESTSEMQEPVG